MGKNSMSREQADAARAMVRDVIARDFGGVAKNAAEAFGLRHSTISDFLAGNRGPGMKLLTGVARHVGCSVDEVLGGRPLALRPSNDPDQRARDEAARFARANRLPEAAIQSVLGHPTRPGLTPLQVFQRMQVAADALGDINDEPSAPVQHHRTMRKPAEK